MPPATHRGAAASSGGAEQSCSSSMILAGKVPKSTRMHCSACVARAGRVSRGVRAAARKNGGVGLQPARRCRRALRDWKSSSETSSACRKNGSASLLSCSDSVCVARRARGARQRRSGAARRMRKQLRLPARPQQRAGAPGAVSPAPRRGSGRRSALRHGRPALRRCGRGGAPGRSAAAWPATAPAAASAPPRAPPCRPRAPPPARSAPTRQTPSALKRALEEETAKILNSAVGTLASGGTHLRTRPGPVMLRVAAAAAAAHAARHGAPASSRGIFALCVPVRAADLARTLTRRPLRRTALADGNVGCAARAAQQQQRPGPACWCESAVKAR